MKGLNRRTARLEATVQLAVVILTFAIALALMVPRSGQLDIEADWLVARAALDGTGAHLPLTALADRYGVEYAPNLPASVADTGLHPRTPGALLLLAPLALLPFGSVVWLWAFLSGGALAGLVLAVGRWWRLPTQYSALYLAAIAASPAGFAAAGWGTQSVLIAVLLLSVPFLLTSERVGLAGVALAIAALLKLFPLLLVLFLLRRPRAIAWCTGTFFGMTAIGLLLPGVELRGSVDGLLFAGDVWFHLSDNGSLATSLMRWTSVGTPQATALGAVLPIMGLLGFVAASMRGRLALTPAYLAALCLALLAAQASWIHYDLVIFPAALWIAAQHPDRRPVILAVACLGFFGWPLLLMGTAGGTVSAVSRLLILAGLVWAANGRPLSYGPRAGTAALSAGSRSGEPAVHRRWFIEALS